MAIHNVSFSPLYTSKRDTARKQAELARLGKDLDGASRVTNRIDHTYEQKAAE